MNNLEFYIPPKIDILYYATREALCYDDGWVRSEDDGSDFSGGIELPDDNWGGGNGEIELPDDII